MLLKTLSFLFLTVLSFASSFSFAQAQNLSISGSFIESNKEAVSFATIALMRVADSTLVKAVVSDESGRFAINGLTQGNYYVSATYMGFKNFKSNVINLTNENLNLNPYILEKQSADLAEVKMIAQRPLIEVLADKTVFNVQNTLNATGTNGFELLRKAPGVVMDNNDNLIVEGKSGVQIFIDGKASVLTGQDLANYLKTVQSADIEAIEIITQPSSKYDAAGTAGIINIKFKRNKNLGTNGSVGIGYAYGKYSKYNSSISLNNRSKKFNVFTNYSNRVGKTWNFMNLNRTQENTLFALVSDNVSDDQNHNVKAGADFFATKKSTCGVLVSGNFSDAASLNTSKTPITDLATNNTNRVLVAQSNSFMNFSNLTGNMNYRFADTLGHSLNVDLDAGKYTNKRSNDQPNTYYNGNESVVLSNSNFYMETPIEVSILSFKVDYEQNLLKGKFGMGFKTSWVNTDNTFNFYKVIDAARLLDNTQSNNFVYKENVKAVYFNYNRKWKKTNLQFGLRGEQTVSEGDLTSVQANNESNVSRNYLNLFPSAGFTYTPNQSNSFAINYSKRIERPNYQTLNPFQRQIDELSFRKGNAYLQPQYVDNIKLSHTYKYTLTTAVSYSFIQDFFAQVTDVLPEGRSFIMERNIATQEVLNLSITYPFNVAKWWGVYASFNASHNVFKGKNDNFRSISQTTFNFYGQNTFTLPAGFKFEVSGWINSPSVWGGTYLTETLGSLDLALQKTFLKDKLSVRLAASDILFTSPWYGSMQFGALKIAGNGGWESRQVRLNLTYNFGGKDVKAARKRNTGIEDENNRL